MSTLSLYDIQNIAGSLGKASRSGQSWVAQCLVHEDKTPSLSLSLGSHGELLAYCHSGCSFQEIVTALKRRGLLPDRSSDTAYFSRSVRASQPAKQENHKEQERAAYTRQKAQELWHKARSPQETLVETYLRTRLGDYFQEIPPTIRFLPSLKHPSGKFFPCMVSAVTHYPSKEVMAVHRTYLSHDGSGKAAVEKAKMLLGNAKGTAVRLAPAGEELIVCEGLEDGLSLQLVLNKSVWVGCSASLMQAMILPPLPLASIVYIAQDNDKAGRESAESLGIRLYAEGRKVKVLTPPQPYKDFNQIIQDNKHIESPTKDSTEPSRKEIR